MEIATKLDHYMIGIGKQGDKLIAILDLAKIIKDVENQLVEQKKSDERADAATPKPEATPIAPNMATMLNEKRISSP
jgi:hypothetical protein